MGAIGAVMVGAGMFAQPLWGVVADRYGRTKGSLLVGTAVSALVGLAFPVIGGAALEPPVLFVLLLAAGVVFASFRAPIMPIANSMVLDSGLEYGSVRAFGAIAFGIGLAGIGIFVEWFETTIVFYIYVVGMAVFFLFLWGLPKPETTVAPDIRSEAVRLLTNRRFLALLVVGVVMGGVVSAGAAFFAVFMRDIQAGDDITGVAWLIRTVGEAVIFLTMARIGLDYRWQLSLGVGLYAVGYAVYGLTGAVPAIISVQLVLGVGYALFNLSTVNLAHRFAPEALSSTAQAVMTGVGIGAGRAVGQLAGGQLVDVVGTQQLYLWLAGATIAALAVSLYFHLPGVGTAERVPAD
jgi:PPP family 3-phenylpropionic acid transporter